MTGNYRTMRANAFKHDMKELFPYAIIYVVRNCARMGKVKELPYSHIANATSANLSRTQLNVTNLHSSTIVSNYQSCYCAKFNNSFTFTRR